MCAAAVSLFVRHIVPRNTIRDQSRKGPKTRSNLVARLSWGGSRGKPSVEQPPGRQKWEMRARVTGPGGCRVRAETREMRDVGMAVMAGSGHLRKHLNQLTHLDTALLET